MFVTTLILLFVSVQPVTVHGKPDSVVICDKIRNLYGKDLKNFGRALAFLSLNDLSSVPQNKITGLDALVNVMKENDHSYTDEVLQLMYNLKQFVNVAKLQKI